MVKTPRGSLRRRKQVRTNKTSEHRKNTKHRISENGHAAEDCATPLRGKVRVLCWHVRLWVNPDDKTKFVNEIKQLRHSKISWTDKAWKAAVYNRARAGYGLGTHGGSGRHGPAADGKNKEEKLSRSQVEVSGILQKSPPVEELGSASGSRVQPVADSVSDRCNSHQHIEPQVLSLRHGESTLTAEYEAPSGAVAVMRAIDAPGPFIPFTPQPVVDWLYQVLGIALSVIQKLLGTDAHFTQSGAFVHKQFGSTASGGMLTTFWGTEMGARRDQGIIAWDYDVDLAAFVTPHFDFGSLWDKAKEELKPLGLRMICHATDFKYRISPIHALTHNDWKERYHLAHLQNPGVGRGGVAKIASLSRRRMEPLQSPSGPNCLDLEVYTVTPHKSIIIRGSKNITISCGKLFPIVEGILGPLRVPLPATSRVLDAEYGIQWRHTRSAKVIRPDGRSSYVKLTCPSARRCVWPAKQLRGCTDLLGGFYGAGLDRSEYDTPWRFAPAKPDDKPDVDSL